ncbi:MAG: hypothetical protein EOP48_33035 [Sphingobacteriales bacterium]|nr:MAG: hypothetical protein EOP48_33035 [Sphingobacteriales bacterium]
MNYVPVMYNDYYILKHPGYNMANWNWHERVLTAHIDNNYTINKKFSLRFFHFSSYSFKTPEVLCRYQNRFDFSSRPDLISIFQEYQSLLLNNDVSRINAAEVFYFPLLNKSNKKNLSSIWSSLVVRLRKTKRMLLKGY